MRKQNGLPMFIDSVDFGSKRTRGSKARAAADPQYHAEPSYMKHRTVGHTETSISGDTRAD